MLKLRIAVARVVPERRALEAYSIASAFVGRVKGCSGMFLSLKDSRWFEDEAGIRRGLWLVLWTGMGEDVVVMWRIG